MTRPFARMFIPAPYAGSAGFGITAQFTDQDGHRYEIKHLFQFPCHPGAPKTALVARVSEHPLKFWVSIPCPLCDATYTIEAEVVKAAEDLTRPVLYHPGVELAEPLDTKKGMLPLERHESHPTASSFYYTTDDPIRKSITERQILGVANDALGAIGPGYKGRAVLYASSDQESVLDTLGILVSSTHASPPNRYPFWETPVTELNYPIAFLLELAIGTVSRLERFLRKEITSLTGSIEARRKDLDAASQVLAKDIDKAIIDAYKSGPGKEKDLQDQ